MRIRASRFAHIPTPPRFAGGMEMMENRLLGLRVALRIRGIATRPSAAHADICLLLGYGVGWLGKEIALGVVGGCADNGVLQGAGVGWLGKRDADEVVDGCADTGSAKGADGFAAAEPITARCRVRAWAGLGKGNWVGGGGIGGAADSGVIGGMEWYRVRASLAAILSGFGSRDMMGSWAKAGGRRSGCVRSGRVNDSLGVCHR